jgi:N-methylhydantoinase A
VIRVVPEPRWRLSVDIGGTFTDVVLVDDATGSLLTAKVLTTADPLDALCDGVREVLGRAGTNLSEVRGPFIHATTLVTNALIAGRTAPVAFVTTEGFADVFEIRTEHRYDIYDLQLEFAPPPVPRERIFTVRERSSASGRVLATPDDTELERLAGQIASCGAEAVAVGFLHAYASPENEARVASFLSERLGLPVCASHDVAPVIREYLRFVTTVANAATISILRRYLERLDRWLVEQATPASVLVMLSNGGAAGIPVAIRYPIRAIESGPAAGALAGAHFARLHGLSQVLCIDMGGTTAKASLLVDGEPQTRASFEYARRYRFLPGSGLPLASPCIDLIEIGAGGGSIARRDEFGLLAVGPASAGADPGPACYGAGGMAATVTDADLMLGYLDADGFAGGRLPLDVPAAEAAIDRLARELDMAPNELAVGVHALANQSMAAAATQHAAERGLDLPGMPLLAFGGAGPVHACGVAELIGASKVVFPPHPSVLSAFGCLASPVRIDLGRSHVDVLDEITGPQIEERFASLRDEGRALLEQSGIAPGDATFRYGIEARYTGQANETTVWIGVGERFPVSPAVALRLFEEHYERTVGMRLADVPIEVVTWRLSVSGPTPPRTRDAVPLRAAEPPPKARRAVRFEADGSPECAAVYERRSLSLGAVIEGPAIVEEPDTTVLIRPGWRAEVAEDGSLVAVRHGERRRRAVEWEEAIPVV